MCSARQKGSGAGDGGSSIDGDSVVELLQPKHYRKICVVILFGSRRPGKPAPRQLRNVEYVSLGANRDSSAVATIARISMPVRPNILPLLNAIATPLGFLPRLGGFTSTVFRVALGSVAWTARVCRLFLGANVDSLSLQRMHIRYLPCKLCTPPPARREVRAGDLLRVLALHPTPVNPEEHLTALRLLGMTQTPMVLQRGVVLVAKHLFASCGGVLKVLRTLECVAKGVCSCRNGKRSDALANFLFGKHAEKKTCLPLFSGTPLAIHFGADSGGAR
ncbi:hypothetical protein B0H13DRAFT_1901333 [Mycena leptocephala]|nr:hypothetical protein B0H13DRAFT_1901333 [Mycena leptocephala]